MRHLKTAATALIVGLVLLMATDYVAMAATGKPLILGKVNKAGKTTTVKATNGPALKLTTKAGQPPLAVNRNTKVANLNADLLDGKSAESFGVRTRVYTATVNENNSLGFAVTTTSVAAGNYLVTLTGFLDVPANSYMQCTVGPESSTTYFIDQWINGNSQGVVTLNAAGVASTSTSEPWQVQCFSEDPGTIASFNGSPVRLSLTSIDTRTSGSATVGSP